MMNKATGLALLATGIALIVFGALDSTGPGKWWDFGSLPTNQTLWLFFCGSIEIVAGTVMTIRSFDREEK